VYSGKPGAEVISFSERVIVAQQKLNVKKIQKLPGACPCPVGQLFGQRWIMGSGDGIVGGAAVKRIFEREECHGLGAATG
jgi:hypothetical protein